jgi:hypothetical protein
VVDPETGRSSSSSASELDDAAAKILERAGVKKIKVYSSTKRIHAGREPHRSSGR